MSKKREISLEEIEAIVAIDPTSEELDAAIKDHLESIVMPERTTPLPKPSDDDDYEDESDDTLETTKNGSETETLKSVVENDDNVNKTRKLLLERAARWTDDFVAWDSAKDTIEETDDVGK